MLRCVLIGAAIGLFASTISPSAAQDRLGSPASLRAFGPPASVVLIAGVIGAQPAYGCGVIVDEQRSTVTILTAAHNLQIQRAEFVTVGGDRLQAERTSVIPNHDLALVTTARPAGAFRVAHLASQPAVGTRVRLWGPIDTEPFTLQDAVVREIDPRVTDPPVGAFALDCAACGHGDSGTGVFDDRGDLLGIVTAAYSADKRRLFVLSERAPESQFLNCSVKVSCGGAMPNSSLARGVEPAAAATGLIIGVVPSPK